MKSYKDRQDRWADENGVEIGSKVRPMFEVPDWSLGWGGTWDIDIMRGSIGNVLNVVGIDENCGILTNLDGSGDNYGFPYFCLEVVVEEKTKSKSKFSELLVRDALGKAGYQNVERGIIEAMSVLVTRIRADKSGHDDAESVVIQKGDECINVFDVIRCKLYSECFSTEGEYFADAILKLMDMVLNNLGDIRSIETKVDEV